MTDHEITIASRDGRWYPRCRCRWDMLVALRDGDATPNKGYFGRATEAEARALADAHLDRHKETAMPRRMQANPKSGLAAHTAEHNETDCCPYPPRCTPVADTATVAVPATGTFLVVDGVVQDTGPSGIRVNHRQNSPGGPITSTYTITARPPKPTFFEEGKTYRREWAAGKKQTYRVDAVRFEDGNAIAFGRLETDDYGVDWVVRRQHHWDGNYGWEEA